MTDTTVYDIIQDVVNLYTDRSKWCQRTSARDDVGIPLSSIHPKACSWCLYGAVRKVCWDRFIDDMGLFNNIENTTMDALANITEYIYHASPISFNDNNPYEAVMEMLRTALQRYGDELKKMPAGMDFDTEDNMLLNLRLRILLEEQRNDRIYVPRHL